MPTIRRPSRGQVRRALDAWATFTRPPDPEKESPADEAGPGEAEAADTSEDADRGGRFLSDRPDPCEVQR